MNAILSSGGEQTPPPNPGPGGRLRAEREHRGLSRERVAAQLHLGESMVDALEADDYDRLPGAVFVKGYVRNYARLLGIPSEPLLEELYHRCPDKECSKFVTGSVGREVRSNHLLIRLATAAIVLALVVLLGVWWWNYAQAPRENGAALADDAGKAAATPAAEPRGQPVLEGAPAAIGAPIPASAITPPKPQAAEQPPAPVVAGKPAEPAVPPPAVEEASAPPPSGKVEIEFSKRSWVDIRGADGSFKMIGEFRKGHRELGGHGPYRFVIGNVSAVHLKVNGQPYSLKPHTSGNVARFQLDPMKIGTN